MAQTFSLLGRDRLGISLHVSPPWRVRSIVKRFCALGCLLAVSAFAVDVQTANLLKTVEQRYNRADSLQVLFHEEYTKIGHAKRSESGVLELRKPGRMRWEYTDPVSYTHLDRKSVV